MTISEDVHRAIQAEGLVTGESPGDVLARLVEGGISPKAREVLSSIGQPVATPIKPDVIKARLTENPKALRAIRDLWQSGVRNRSEIARRIGYPKATVAENIKRMLAAGELLEEEEAGEG